MPPAQVVQTSPSSVTGEFFFSLGGANGRMTATADGFVLRAGDGVVEADKPALKGAYKALREKLRENGSLAPIAGSLTIYALSRIFLCAHRLPPARSCTEAR